MNATQEKYPLDKLRGLLRKPRAAYAATAWKRLTTAGEPIASLQACVKARTMLDRAEASDLLEAWLPLIQADLLFETPPEEERRRLSEMELNERKKSQRRLVLEQWQIVKALVFCAVYAAGAPKEVRGLEGDKLLKGYLDKLELDRCCFALAGRAPDSTPGGALQKSWAWGCITSFLPERAVVARLLDVPIVAYDRNQKMGHLCTLRLEVLEGGTGEAFHHPQDALVTKPELSFYQSIQEAFTAARELVRAEVEKAILEPTKDGATSGEADVRFNLRWRVLTGWAPDASSREKLPPAVAVGDRSGSAAAARGSHFALPRRIATAQSTKELTRKVPDDRVVVIAQVDPERYREGLLAAVENEGLEAKVAAIVAAGCFDTIAVVEKNKSEADKALANAVEAEKIKSGDIRVVDIAKYRNPAEENI